jgi:hypothetical protein
VPTHARHHVGFTFVELFGRAILLKLEFAFPPDTGTRKYIFAHANYGISS